jgi:peptide/nickel transport system permease protein
LGTDELGRDIYSRIVHGSRLTLYIIGIVAIVVGPVGLMVGTIAGYLGGWVDRVLMPITVWPPYARMARAETLTIRKADYIAAVRIQGGSTSRIIGNHIVPMCMSSLIVRLTLDMAGIILTAAGLGFLGLGAQPPLPEWGAMISTGRQYLLEQWWVATMPGLAIFFVSLGFNLLGDGLRDVLDPRRTGA